LKRGLITAQFTNVGTQGGTIAEVRAHGIGLVYPRQSGGDVVTGGGWKNLLTTHSSDCNSEAHFEGTSLGEGIWLSVKVPASFPVYRTFAKDGLYVVYTNPRGDLLTEIAPMMPDPAKDPELAGLGVQKVVPKPAETAGLAWRTDTYWPGSAFVQGEMKKPALQRIPPEVQNYDFYRYIPNDNWPESIVLTQWTTLAGVTFTRRAMQWSYPDWDDFIVVEMEFQNTGDSNGDGTRDLPEETLSDLYVSFVNSVGVSSAGTAWRFADQWFRFHFWTLDDRARYSESPNYAGPARGKNLKISYHFDGDNPQIAHNDTGDPVVRALQPVQCNTGRIDGEFTSFQFVGMAPLAYGGDKPFNGRDAARGYATPAGPQPRAVRWWKAEGEKVSNDPRATLHSRSEIYNLATAAGVDSDPPVNELAAWFSGQTYGPYTLAPGAKGKIVMTYVVGSGAGDGDIYTWTRKNTNNLTELARGEEWMVRFAERANWAYQNDYDLPDPPPDVYARVLNSDNATNLITWADGADNALDPDYAGAEAADVAGYRVYRSEWTPDGPWTLIAETRKDALAKDFSRDARTGIYTYEDVSSVSGFNYWYSVRAFDRGHASWSGRAGTMATLPADIAARVKAGLEGGYAADEQKAPIPRSPSQPAIAATDRLERQVYVVPNPFWDDGSHKYPGKNDLRFVNVPTRSEIYVFSSSGDLMAHFLHDDTDKTSGRLGEVSWGQMATSMTGEISSGVYFYVVKSLMPESMGKIQRGKFFVIK